MMQGSAPPEEPVEPGFFTGLADDGRPDEATIEALLAEQTRRHEAERGLGAWLRQRSTAARLGLGLGLPTGLVLAAALLAPRPDIADVPTWRILAIVLVTAVLLGSSVWFGLRPLHRPPAPRWVEPALLCASLAGIVGLALLPLFGAMPAEGPDDWVRALACSYAGLIVALPAFVVFRLLDRGGRAFSSLLAAAAAGLGANAVLAFHCPNDAVLHLMKGHVLVGVGFVLGVAAWRAWLGRLHRGVG